MSSAGNSVVRDALGIVKWFDARKGYGFIKGPDDQDVFAHFSVIEGDGFRIMKDGWTVTYDAELTPTGWRATRIVLPPGALTELPQPRKTPDAPSKPPGSPKSRPSPKAGEVVVRPRARPASTADRSSPPPPPSSAPPSGDTPTRPAQ